MNKKYLLFGLIGIKVISTSLLLYKLKSSLHPFAKKINGKYIGVIETKDDFQTNYRVLMSHSIDDLHEMIIDYASKNINDDDSQFVRIVKGKNLKKIIKKMI